ncbi:PTS sugar transporter subunit IIA [candidate division KSB1 bacterium]
MIRGLILTHGDFGRSVISTTEKIMGPVEGVKVISNEMVSIKDLVSTLDTSIKEFEEDEVLIMVDFCGGSCWHAAQVVMRDRPKTALISGVNLPMALAFANKRDSYKLTEFAEYLKESSVKGTEIKNWQEEPEDKNQG